MFKKGQSGNPSGRPKLDPDTRALIKKNGEKAAKRLQQLMKNDKLFAREEVDDNGEVISIAGDFSPKDQLTLIEVALSRAYGKAGGNLTVEHNVQGQVDHNHMDMLKTIQEKLPERIGQQRAVEVIDAEVEHLPVMLDDPSLLRD